MKIGIDGRYAEGDLVGVGNYIKNLVEGLTAQGFESVIFYSKKPKYQINNTKMVIIKTKNRYLFEQFYLPKYFKDYKIDLYHATGNVGTPLFTFIPIVLTVHDLIPIDFENYFKYSKVSFLSKNIYQLNTIVSCLKAKKIITISKFVKKEVSSKFNISEGKIEVIYSGVSEVKGGTLPKELIGKKYILNHGGIDVRKNLQGMIFAFSEFVKKFPEYKLVITGENLYLKSKLERLVHKLKLGKFVLFVGYVPEQNLWAIIKNAKCICYPSFMEGFGMPVIEGFKVGIPVVTSNTTSLLEISDGGAVLVDPNDYRKIAHGIISAIDNKKIVARGRKIVKKYNWKTSVAKTVAVYMDVVDKSLV